MKGLERVAEKGFSVSREVYLYGFTESRVTLIFTDNNLAERTESKCSSKILFYAVFFLLIGTVPT